MERNTLSKKIYVWKSISWSIIAFILYKKFFFVQLSAKSVLESNLILIVMIIITIAANLFLTMRWDRNSISAGTATLIPYAVYTYFSFEKCMPKTYRIILFIAVGLCVLLLICIFAIKMNEKTMRSLILKLKMTYLAVRLIWALAGIAFMICVICWAYMNGIWIL